MRIFKGLLSPAFQPSTPFLFAAERVTLDFAISGQPVEWYLEFTSDDPNDIATIWKREVAEEDVGGGVTHMPAVVRDFPDDPDEPGNFSVPMIRTHKFCRIQIRDATGLLPPSIMAEVLAVFGAPAQTPAVS
jgi:hypothetical protein